jgi:peptide/nickel transport system substrate-binding protein
MPTHREEGNVTMASTPLITTRRGIFGLSAAAMLASATRPAAAATNGTLTVASHVSLAPTWFDPAETAGIITPFMLLYAMHDAVAKAMPDGPMSPCLASSWTMAPDGRSYEFVLRSGVKFHNGDTMTSEDVKFSFERYRGASHQLMKDRVAAIETPDPSRTVFRLPDLLRRRIRRRLDRAQEIFGKSRR